MFTASNNLRVLADALEKMAVHGAIEADQAAQIAQALNRTAVHVEIGERTLGAVVLEETGDPEGLVGDTLDNNLEFIAAAFIEEHNETGVVKFNSDEAVAVAKLLQALARCARTLQHDHPYADGLTADDETVVYMPLPSFLLKADKVTDTEPGGAA